MPVPSEASPPETAIRERSLPVLLFMHFLFSFGGWLAPLMISEGGTFCLPYNLALPYTMFLGCFLHFLTNNGIDSRIWWVGAPLSILFLLWSIPFGVVFLLYFAAIFATIRTLHSGANQLLVPGALYVVMVIFMLAY